MDIDKKTPAYKIICNHCRQSEKIAAPGSVLHPEFVARKFRQKGWIVSRKGNHDICPSCMRPEDVLNTIPPAKLLEFSPTKPCVISSFKELAKAMTPAPTTNPIGTPPPPLMNKVEDKPKAPDVTGTNWKVVEPDETKSFALSPMFELPGEIRRARVVESGWATNYAIRMKVMEKKLTTRKAPLRKSFLKIDEVIREFGEPRPLVANLLSKTKSTPVNALPAPTPAPVAPTQMLNKESAPMNHDPRIPPEMTKEDRRIIFAEIDTHYLDETTGYATDYNDKRIADGLKVPLAWVRTIREENFGPEKSADFEYKTLKTLVENAETTLNNVNNTMARAKIRISELESMQEALIKQIGGVNATIVNVNARIAHLTGKK
jgi:hypothetical protein